MLPELLASRTSRRVPRPGSLPEECCWTTAEVLNEASTSAPLVVSAHNFLCDPQALRQLARRPPDGRSWQQADIHPNEQLTHKNATEALLRGNGFPGWRLVLKPKDAATTIISRCLRPLVTAAWGEEAWGERGFAAVTSQQHLFGLVSAAHQPGGSWLDAQRLPHTDIRWDLGTSGDARHVPPSIATVLALSSKWNASGTAFWRVTGTTRSEAEKPSLLPTLRVNEEAQGGFSGRTGPRGRHPHLDLRAEVPDPHPHSVLKHAWAEAIAVALLRFNRIVVYDGRRLHNRYIEGPDYVRLSTSPGSGRLTLNSFLWQSAQ